MHPSNLTLVEPSVALEAAYLAYVEDFCDAGEGQLASFKLNSPGPSFAEFVERLESQARGEALPPGFVQQTTFWLVRDGGTILGESRMRHSLTPALEQMGGHIGYAIRPSERKRGYGTLILALTKQKAREIGLTRVLVTCNPENIGSAKIIETNGGMKVSDGVHPETERPVSRYWIEL